MVGKRSSRALIGRNPVRNEARFRPSSLRFGGGVRGPQRLDLSCEAQDEGGGGSSARPRGHPAASGSLRAQWAHADVGSGPRRDLGWIWVQAYRLSAVVGLTQARIHRRDLRARRPASGRLQISDPRISRGSWAHSNACADPIGLVQGSMHRCAAIRGDRPSVEEEVLPRASLEGAGWAFAKADTEDLAQSVISRIAARDFDRSASSGDP